MKKFLQWLFFIPVGIILFSVSDVLMLYMFNFIFSFYLPVNILLYPFGSAFQVSAFTLSSYALLYVSPVKVFTVWLFIVLFTLGSIGNIFINPPANIPYWINVYVRITNIFLVVYSLPVFFIKNFKT